MSPDRLSREQRLTALVEGASNSMALAGRYMGRCLLDGFVQGLQGQGILVDEARRLQEARSRDVTRAAAHFSGLSFSQAQEAMENITRLSIGHNLEIPIVQTTAIDPTEIHIRNISVADLPHEQELVSTTEMRRVYEEVARQLEEEALGAVRDENGVLRWQTREGDESVPEETATGQDGPITDFEGIGDGRTFFDYLQEVANLMRGEAGNRSGTPIVGSTPIARQIERQIRDVPWAPARFADVAYQQEQVGEHPPPGVMNVDQVPQDRHAFFEGGPQPHGTDAYMRDGETPNLGYYSSSVVRVICAGNYQEYLHFCRDRGINPHGEGAPLYAGPNRCSREALRGYNPEEIIVIGTYRESMETYHRMEHDAFPGLDAIINTGYADPLYVPDLEQPGQFHPMSGRRFRPPGTPEGESGPSYQEVFRTRWDQKREDAHKQLADLGMSDADFQAFWERANRRFNANKASIWNLSGYLLDEIAVQKVILEGKDPFQVWTDTTGPGYVAYLGNDTGDTFRKLMIAVMNDLNIESMKRARTIAREYTNMMRWT